MTGVVLLTGATGFVGRQVLKALLSAGRSVRVVVRPDSVTKLGRAKEIEQIVICPDLFCETAEWWSEICSGVDTIVHVAWYAEPGKYLMSPKNLDCLSGTIALAQGAIIANVRRFIGIGTCFEYDLSMGDLSTETPLNPKSPYAAAKASAYFSLSEALFAVGMEFGWCRLFYLYGEGEDTRRFVPYLRAQLEKGEPADLTNGKQIRDFMDVQDAGCAIAHAAIGSRQGAINIRSGQPISIRRLAEQIADEYDRIDLLKFGVREDNQVDPRRVVGVPTLLT